jgi:acyl carrier protein
MPPQFCGRPARAGTVSKEGKDMGDYQAIIEEVATILSEKTKIKREHLKPELHLEESGLDSFARIELVLAMEEHFGIELSDSEAADLSTVDDVARVIMSKQ